MKKRKIDISFIFYIAVDNEERRQNLAITAGYYRNHIEDPKFFFIEEIETESKILDLIDPDDFHLTIPKKHKYYNKSAGYNVGLSFTTTKYVALVDVDCIVEPIQLELAIESMEYNNSTLCYPYDGRFYCCSKDLKYKFKDAPIISTLKQHTPYGLQLGQDNGLVMIGHTASVGGIVCANREKLIECGGYNPNYIGWAEEDNDVIIRVNKLGHATTRVQGYPVWHLYHSDEHSFPREKHEHYEDNVRLRQRVQNMTKEETQEYIKTWSIP